MMNILKIVSVMAAMFLLGCTTPNTPEKEKTTLPAITKEDTHKYYSGKFVWHDLLTDDVASAKKFYGTLFGWTFEDNENYTLIKHNEKPIGGMMKVTDSTKNNVEALWLPSMSVSNVDSAITYVKRNDGKVLKGPLDMKERGRGVLVSDAQGAHLVLLHTKSGDPIDATPQMGDWLWNELWTDESVKSYNFYRHLGQYDRSKEKDNYRILKTKGKWRAGIRHIKDEKISAHWIPVVRVTDPKAVTAKVASLGGKVLFEANDSLYDGNVAVIVDSSGALLIVQRWTKGQK